MKLELNVQRLLNDDVIATSGVCSHIGSSEFDGGSFRANHIYVDIENDEFIPYVDADSNGKLDAGSTVGKSLSSYIGSYSDEFRFVFDSGWYYFDGVEFGKCDENCTHPKDK